MFETLATTFYNNAVAAYEEYVKFRDAPQAGRDQHLRTAIAASTALYHFREHLPDKLRGSVTNLERTSADFELLRGVANAAKHGHVTHRNPLVAKAEHISEVTVIVRYTDEEGEYSHVKTIIEVICTDSTTRWLDPAITRTINLWGKLLSDAGICNYAARLEPEEPGSRHILRTEASTNFNLEAMRGLDFRQSLRLLRFDSHSGSAASIDLSGAEMQFRIYKPKSHIFDITLSHPIHGDISVSVNLTNEENIQFHQIESQAEHNLFIEALYQAHWAEIQEKLRDRLMALG